MNDLAALHIRETDFTAVLGNLLNNAIETCQKLPQPELLYQDGAFRVSLVWPDRVR